jgi:hypothetical protein
MFIKTVKIKNRINLHFVSLGLMCLTAILGCGSGEIENFEGIQATSIYRSNALDINIFLLDENGNALIWNQSILSPSIGVTAVSETEFKTNIQLYSSRQGQRGMKVYDGRLIDLRWATQPRAAGSPIRILRAYIPHPLIKEDPERDSEMGSMTVTIQTDKQGPFTDTKENVQIYSRFR